MLQTMDFPTAGKRGLLKPINRDRYADPGNWPENENLQKDSTLHLEQLLYTPQNNDASAETKLCVPTFKGFALLKLENIIFCEADRNYTVIHLTNLKPVMVSRPLLEYDKILRRASFLRIHRSYLINLQHITEYRRADGGIVVMSNGAQVQISRRKREQFLLRVKKEFWK